MPITTKIDTSNIRHGIVKTCWTPVFEKLIETVTQNFPVVQDFGDTYSVLFMDCNKLEILYWKDVTDLPHEYVVRRAINLLNTAPMLDGSIQVRETKLYLRGESKATVVFNTNRNSTIEYQRTRAMKLLGVERLGIVLTVTFSTTQEV